MKLKGKLDSTHYHEALDRTYLAINFLDEILTQHPVYENHKKFKKKINKIIDDLSELYQNIGALNYIKHIEEKNVENQSIGKVETFSTSDVFIKQREKE